MHTWKPSQAAFHSYEEVDGGRGPRRSVRRVLNGEGRLTPERDFTWNGERYRANVTRVAPDHPVTQSEHAHLLTPAYAKESGYAVLTFLERVRGRKGQRRADTFPKRPKVSRHDYWTLGAKTSTEQTWRLS
jgi:hypothetical protein